jgi:hypothetical protein
VNERGPWINASAGCNARQEMFVLAIHHCEQDPLAGSDCCNRGTVVLAVLKNGIVAYGLLHDEAGSSVMEGGICLSVAVSQTSTGLDIRFCTCHLSCSCSSTDILHGSHLPVGDPANRLTPCHASGNSGGCVECSHWPLL